jgi:hypothetical protein
VGIYGVVVLLDLPFGGGTKIGARVGIFGVISLDLSFGGGA